MRIFWTALLIVAIAACGSGGNNDDANGGTNNDNGTPPEGECDTDEDCPDASDAPFARPETVGCWDSLTRGSYCSECINDDQCERGFACRDSTYCEELPPCESGRDCASVESEVHDACVNGFCAACIDDSDCEDDEVCYSRQCATRTTVDPTCIEATCEGPCEIDYDDDGGATGVSCME